MCPDPSNGSVQRDRVEAAIQWIRRHRPGLAEGKISPIQDCAAWFWKQSVPGGLRSSAGQPTYHAQLGRHRIDRRRGSTQIPLVLM